MAKQRLIVFLLVVLIGLPLVSLQAQEAELAGPAEVLGGGGPLLGLLRLDLGKLNEWLEANGYAPLDDMVFVMGGGGYGGEVRGLRFGGLGWGGGSTSMASQKAAMLSLGFGGFLIERELFAGEGYSLLLGAVIGGGGADLDLLAHHSASFEDTVSNPPNTSLTRGFFAIQTYAGLELALLDWITLKVNLGYLWTFCGPWLQAGFSPFGPPAPPPIGLPETFSAPLIQVMIVFGGRAKLEEEKGPGGQPQE